jgi:hypothetical protein
MFRIIGVRLFDLSNGKFFQLKSQQDSIDLRSIGILKNNLILASNDKIYFYHKPKTRITNATSTTVATGAADAADAQDEIPSWEYSREYDIEIPGSINEFKIQFLVYQTKLFIFNPFILIQWDLSTMVFEMQYNINGRISGIVINKDENVLALDIDQETRIDIYSMENGIRISSYG